MDRFEFLNENEIQDTLDSVIPNSTRKNTQWCTNTWDAWARARNSARQLGQPKVPLSHELQCISSADFDYFVCHFVMEVRNCKGHKYPGKTLLNLCAGLCRYLRTSLNRADLNFLNNTNISFNKSRQALDAVLRKTTSEGIGLSKKSAEPITRDQEKILWDQGLLGMHNSLTLSRTMYFYNCKVFGLRARDEHRTLMRDQFSIKIDNRGKHFLEFQGRVSKNTCGGLAQKNINLKNIRQYEDPENRNSVFKLFCTYFSHIPETGPFYRRPLPSPGLKFSDQVVGINTLAKYIPDIMKSAGIDGYFTGHSGKVTTATSLYQSGVDEQLIRERTGHRSDAVRAYKRTGSDQQEKISKLLDVPTSGDKAPVLSKTAPVPSKTDKTIVKTRKQEEKVKIMSDDDLLAEVDMMEQMYSFKHKKFRRSSNVEDGSTQEYGSFDLGDPFQI